MPAHEWTCSDKHTSETLTLDPDRRVVDISWELHVGVGHVTDIRGGRKTWSFAEFLAQVEDGGLRLWKRLLPEICEEIRTIEAASPPK